MNHETATRIHAEPLRLFAEQLLAKNGMPEPDARIVAEHLVSANLRGVDTHGVLRLRIYIDRIKAGGNNPVPSIRVVNETPVSAVLDGDNSLGQVCGHKAMHLAIAKARDIGIGIVTARNSNHYGMAGHYAMMALDEAMIGISMTNVLASMPPTGGREAKVGNNPLAIAFPAGDELPVVLDAATSLSSWGRVFVAMQSGESLPEGFFLDQAGNPTLRPEDVLNGGLLLPIAGYKGYGLALCISFLTGLLSGGTFDAEIPHPNLHVMRPGENAFFMAAIRVDPFVPVEQFRKHADEAIRQIRASKRVPGVERIYLPGEKEFETESERSRSGIPLSPEMQSELRQLADDVGLAVPGFS